MSRKWENYGDVNPVEHGGLWISKDPDTKSSYYLVEFNPFDGGGYRIGDAYIDLTDSWISWEDVESYVDNMETDIEKVIGIHSYYGAEHSGGTYLNFNTLEEALAELRTWDITV